MMQCDEGLNHLGELVDREGNKVTHLLATEKYQSDPSTIHPMSNFERHEITNYVQDT